MKKLFTITIGIAIMLAILTGCCDNDEYLEQECEELRTEIVALQEQKATIETEIIDAKETNGTAKYVVTFRIKQSHFTLDIGEHIKDAMNEITIEIPVDKEYYDSVAVGNTVNDDFRVGSLIMHGSFSNWNVIVERKEVR